MLTDQTSIPLQNRDYFTVLLKKGTKQDFIYRIRGTGENHRIINYNYVTGEEEPDMDSFTQQEKFGEYHRIF